MLILLIKKCLMLIIITETFVLIKYIFSGTDCLDTSYLKSCQVDLRGRNYVQSVHVLENSNCWKSLLEL